MWSIEISSDTSEEEIDQILRDELDFEYIRECVAKLKMLVEKYGPFKEIQEKTEESGAQEFTKTYDDNRGWICEGLESFDSRRVWTLVEDRWNGYSWIHSGYSKESSGAKEITSWYVAEKPIEEEEIVYSNTEFIIGVNYEDDEEDEDYFVLDLWSLIDSDEVSDEAIMDALAN